MGWIEPEMCTKMLRNLSEKLATKFSATTLSYSVVKIARLNDAFSAIFKLEAISRRSITAAKDTEWRRREGDQKIKKIKKPRDIGHFFDRPKTRNLKILISAHAQEKYVVKRGANGRKGM